MMSSTLSRIFDKRRSLAFDGERGNSLQPLYDWASEGVAPSIVATDPAIFERNDPGAVDGYTALMDVLVLSGFAALAIIMAFVSSKRAESRDRKTDRKRTTSAGARASAGFCKAMPLESPFVVPFDDAGYGGV